MTCENRRHRLAKFTYSYPADQPERWLLRPHKFLLSLLSTRKINRRRRRQGNSVKLDLLNERPFRDLQVGDLPLIFLTHNDKRFVSSFLAHYRAIGVTRFICVDDGSSDGTREALLSQHDVDVWVSQLRYGEAMRGKLWREALVRRYGYQRWYLNTDSDEYLIYPEWERRTLPELINVLEARGQWRLPGPMIDLYGVDDISKAQFDGNDERMPWTVADHFDREGYQLSFEQRFMSMRGGPRARLFGAEAELMKYPLLFWDNKVNLGVSIHQPTPFHRNFAPIQAALLHFKFFSDFEKRAADAVADEQYFAGAQEYQRILEAMNNSTIQFAGSSSIRYRSADTLVEHGLISSPFVTSKNR
jgi:glycosyltransferase involved in cell wall biosynthesis